MLTRRDLLEITRDSLFCIPLLPLRNIIKGKEREKDKPKTNKIINMSLSYTYHLSTERGDLKPPILEWIVRIGYETHKEKYILDELIVCKSQNTPESCPQRIKLMQLYCPKMYYPIDSKRIIDNFGKLSDKGPPEIKVTENTLIIVFDEATYFGLIKNWTSEKYNWSRQDEVSTCL